MIFASATLGQIKSPKLWCQTCTSSVFLLECHWRWQQRQSQICSRSTPPSGNAWYISQVSQPQVSVKWLVRWPAYAAQRALLEPCCGFPHVEQAWGSDVWKSAGAHGAASLDKHRVWLLSLAVTNGMGARGMDQWRLLGCEPGEETPEIVDGPGI